MHFQEVLIRGLIAHTFWQIYILPYFTNGNTQIIALDCCLVKELPAELSHVAVKLVPAFNQGRLKTTIHELEENYNAKLSSNLWPCSYSFSWKSPTFRFCTDHPGNPLLEALMDNCPPLFESNNLRKSSRSCKSSLEMTKMKNVSWSL